jgi:predicted PurR-regulated permease PerM
MEIFGIIGFIFGVTALAKVITLEKQIKESGVLKEQTKSEDK